MDKTIKPVKIAQKVIIVDGEKILSIRRSKTDKGNPGKWDLPGGKINFGEELIPALLREVDEETSLQISDIKTFENTSVIFTNGFYIMMIYTAKLLDGKITLSYEHDDFKWVDAGNYDSLEWQNWQVPIIKRYFENSG